MNLIRYCRHLLFGVVKPMSFAMHIMPVFIIVLLVMCIKWKLLLTIMATLMYYITLHFCTKHLLFHELHMTLWWLSCSCHCDPFTLINLKASLSFLFSFAFHFSSFHHIFSIPPTFLREFFPIPHIVLDSMWPSFLIINDFIGVNT